MIRRSLIANFRLSQCRAHGNSSESAVKIDHVKTKVSDWAKPKVHQDMLQPFQDTSESPKSLKFYIETYGCQMNLSDSEIVRSILLAAGHEACNELDKADVILTNTCAVRENAESKVWNRLKFFQSMRIKNRIKGTRGYSPMVGVLGCMAERLKEKLLVGESVDFVCGPDAYRDLPHLVNNLATSGQKQANTLLSFEETYADISPVREVNDSCAFVSIMRGCNNMCSFCIVPFTRGRERSRPMDSILGEVRALSDAGVKEVVLLGQNVNGYHDTSSESANSFPASTYQTTTGFTSLFNSRKRDLPGARFADLLIAISDINPEMRIRFTSPHPKDFPADVLSAISERPNICSSVHLPAQSGSTSMLKRMRRGYSREAFLQLVKETRDLIPGVTISTDIIAGFCDETEEEHQDTVSLMREVRFDQAFMYAYSLRDRTHAAHTMSDNIPEDVKKRRLQEIIDVYRDAVISKNAEMEHGAVSLVLVEAPDKRSTVDNPVLTGRTDGNKRVLFPASDLIPASAVRELIGYDAPVFGDIETMSPEVKMRLLSKGGIFNIGNTNIHEDHAHMITSTSTSRQGTTSGIDAVDLSVLERMRSMDGYTPADSLIGKYVAVRILKANTTTLRGVALGVSSIKEFPAFLSSFSKLSNY